MIVDCPDFEYVACLHDSEYPGGDVANHIKSNFNFGKLESFKSNPKIYSFLNTGSKSYQYVMNQLEQRAKIISNRYKRDNVLICMLNTITNWNLIGQRNSNISEIFDIILDS